MTKSLLDMAVERDKAIKIMEIMEHYRETFGDDSGPLYSEDIEETAKVLKHCLEVGKSYEELYGEDDKNAIY